MNNLGSVKMSANKLKNNHYKTYGKRIFDIIGATTALLLLLPLLTFTALLVRFRLGRQIFFYQERPGLNEKTFKIIKFRTMTNQYNENGILLPDEERLTSLGALLRKTSIDELPELINVLKGDMSIVGPRPLFMEYLPYYTKREKLRHCVRPGITGLSQISGRNYLPWDDRLETDVQYVENLSFFLDIKIILQTFFKVMKTKDVAVLPGRIGVPLSVYRREMTKFEADD